MKDMPVAKEMVYCALGFSLTDFELLV